MTSPFLELEARDDAAQSSLHSFFEQTLLQHIPVEKRVPAPHHELVCRFVEDFLVDTDAGFAVINLPPGGVKSQLVAQCLPAWLMLKYPNYDILAAAATMHLSERNGKIVRSILQSPAAMRVSPVTLNPNESAATLFSTSNGSRYWGIGAATASMGARAMLVCIDDPIGDFETAQSETQLQKLRDWLDNVLETRLKPGGKVILICQRLARNDLAGYLLDRRQRQLAGEEGMAVRSLVIPMEATTDNAAADPMRRAPGELMWPGMWSPARIADMKRDAFKWKCLFQQEPPSDSGSWVDIGTELNWFDTTPENLSYRTLTDLAVSINRGDESAHLIVGTDNDKNVYVVDAWHVQASQDVVADRLLDMIQTYAPIECLADDDNMAKVFFPSLYVRGRERGVSFSHKLLPMRGQDKETRAAPLRGMFKRGKIFFKRNAPWVPWLCGQLALFPNATGSGVDDGVDALGLIGRRVIALAGGAATPPPPKRLPTVHEMTLNDLFDAHEIRSPHDGVLRI